MAAETRFNDLEFAFDTGGLIRGALNEGKSTPLNIRVTGKDLTKQALIAAMIKDKGRPASPASSTPASSSARITPSSSSTSTATKAADLGMTQEDVMRNVVAALNSSITFNKKNFWIDPKSHNQYFVGVAYPEKDITSLEIDARHPDHRRLEGGSRSRSARCWPP